MYPISSNTKIKTDMSIDFLFSFLNNAISSSRNSRQRKRDIFFIKLNFVVGTYRKS